MSHTFARNFLVQAIGKGLSVLIGLLTVALLTRSLGAEAFGEYTTAITFLQFFGIVVDFGLTLSLVVMISEPGADEERLTGNILTVRIVSAIVLFGFAPFAVLLSPWSSTVKEGVAIGAFGYACMAGAALLVGIFQKHQNVWRASLGELLNRIILFGLVCLFASVGLGTLAMLWATTAANAAWLVTMILFARPFVRIRPRMEWPVWKMILRRSWPMALSIFFNLIYLKGDILFLALFRAQTDVGHYGAAYRIIDVLTVIPTIFMGLLLPTLVADWKSGRREEFARHVQRAFNAFAVMFLPAIAGAQALAVPILHFIAGRQFDASGLILQWLVFALPGVFFGTLYGYAVVAVDKQYKMIFGYLLCALISVAGYFILIPRFGTMGAAMGTIFSETFIAIIAYVVVQKEQRVKLSLHIPSKALLASLLMYCLLRLLPPMPVLLAIGMGVFAYAGFLFLFGLRKKMLMELLPSQLASH